MRVPTAGDHWKDVYEKKYGYKINSLVFENLRGLGSGSINFSGGITAICGANGVGKTTLLKAVERILNSDGTSSENGRFLKLGEVDLTGDLKAGADQITRTVSITQERIAFDPQEIKIECNWVDASIQAPSIIELFSNMDNIPELLEGEGESDADVDEIGILSYIVNKRYSSCKTYEIELAEKGIVPYFKVIYEGVEYGSEQMGLGEKAAHYIYWNLKRVPKNSILLIEEPETYLAPRSQEALLDVLAKISHNKKVWVILTTHSPGILKSIPPKHVRFLSQGESNIEVIEPKATSDYLQSLGISTKKSGVIFVEDRAARVFSKYWLGKYSPYLLQEYDIIDISGVDNIVQQLKDFPSGIKWFKIFGLFDGDQRTKIKDKFNWKYSFLPGVEPVEKQFIQLARDNRVEFSSLLRIDLTQLNIALAILEGKDHHDWLIELPDLIGLSYEQLIATLFDLGMTDEKFKTDTEDAYKQLFENLF